MNAPDGVHYPGLAPLPDPEHQQRITRQKVFEIVCVLLLICGGVGYLMWRGDGMHVDREAPRTLQEAVAIVEAEGYSPREPAVLHGRLFAAFGRVSSPFESHIALVGPSADEPVEMVLLWLTPQADVKELSPAALKAGVDAVARHGQLLVPSMMEALEKAVNTMVFQSDTERVHDKGVAGTDDAWKLTYVTYHAFDEGDTAQPALVLLLQRLSAASDPALADFNRTLYRAVSEGVSFEVALRASAAG